MNKRFAAFAIGEVPYMGALITRNRSNAALAAFCVTVTPSGFR
jgi:hypothetical protein